MECQKDYHCHPHHDRLSSVSISPASFLRITTGSVWSPKPESLGIIEGSFYRRNAFHAAQSTASKHRRVLKGTDINWKKLPADLGVSWSTNWITREEMLHLYTSSPTPFPKWSLSLSVTDISRFSGLNRAWSECYRHAAFQRVQCWVTQPDDTDDSPNEPT